MAPPEPVPQMVRSPVSAGQIVDRKYRVDAVLGAGGMGIVVSATHLELDEPVALKFMTIAGGKGDSTSRARFLREAKAARKLTSAHVARVFDVGQLPSGEPYIVMELLRGDDLAKHLRTQGRLTVSDTVRFVLQVCDAIREAHALGIVHRDLKPQNLFLAQRPGGGTLVKVLDFGIAKSLETTGDSSDASLTTSQNVVGSPVYMSPEQLRASKHVDSRTDIWSLGVIMFELLSGKTPFVGDSVMELGMRIMTVPAPSLVELRTEIPGALADVVQRCLEKNPDRRYATVDALASALRPFVDTSHRTLPFADTLDEGSSPPPFSDLPRSPRPQLPTGGEFGNTKGGTAGSRRSFWRGLALPLTAALAVAVAVTTTLWPHAPHKAALTADAPAGREPPPPATFHVSMRVTPPDARLRLDSEGPLGSPFARDLPVDGLTHTVVVEADGYETREVSFRDAPPPPEVILTALTRPAAAPSASTTLATKPSPPPSARHEPPHVKQVTPTPTAATPPPAVPSDPSAVPRTANDSPIVR